MVQTLSFLKVYHFQRKKIARAARVEVVQTSSSLKTTRLDNFSHNFSCKTSLGNGIGQT